MNKVTRADVEVQPYAFTTKALYVGHMDHRFLRWQVVDTPGILDRPIEERNTIEMQAITALAHLQCCVLYFLDISETCGYPIDQQLKLFQSIYPLFTNKQVIIVANKIDVVSYESLSKETRDKIENMAKLAKAEVIPMSNVSEENIGQLKITACDRLLEARVDAKLSQGKVKNDIMARITVATPKPRDGVNREAFIPESVKKLQEMSEKPTRMTEKDLMWANGGPGVYNCDYRKLYELDNNDWKFDTIPEIMDGKNVMDFFDPDIEEKLNALEEEEAQLEASGAYELDGDDDEEELDEEDLLLYEAIKEKQTIARNKSHQTKTTIPKAIQLKHRSDEDIKEQLESVGLESSGVLEKVTRGRKRERSIAPDEDDMDVDNSEQRGRSKSKSKRERSQSVNAKRHRAHSATRGPRESSVAPHQEKQVAKSKKTMDRAIFRYARSGEADREHYPKLVKHLNSGKRSLGTSTIGR
jgi:nucleolar GTP-binding protein